MSTDLREFHFVLHRRAVAEFTYCAPSVPSFGSTTTRFRYDADLRMRSIVRAPGDSVTMSYDAAGRPASVAHADGTTSFTYGALTGLLSTVSSSTGGSYAMTYDGSLLTSATLSGGPVTGSITYGYDNFFRPRSIAVNGNAITRAYDTDGLLLSAGALTIARSVSTGLAASAAVDGVATAYLYDSTGIVTSATTTANGIPLYAYQLEREGQWMKGKCFPTFGPLGPWLVTPDEVPDPQALGLWLEVNGERLQHSNTRTMIFPIRHLVSYISRFMVLEPGDVITTGTPPGVGLGMKPERYLKAGDTMRLGVDGLGVQQQRVRAWAAAA